jgi:DNA-binding transcriptional regulator YhcF (GntR family)
MFKTARVNRISQNIVEQIRETIISGRLKPGDRLPSEKDLSVEFGVSKASLREALRALEALGMLEVKQGMGGGAFVTEVDLETARNNMFNYIFFQNPSIGEFTQLRTFSKNCRPLWAKKMRRPPNMSAMRILMICHLYFRNYRITWSWRKTRSTFKDFAFCQPGKNPGGAVYGRYQYRWPVHPGKRRYPAGSQKDEQNYKDRCGIPLCGDRARRVPRAVGRSPP